MRHLKDSIAKYLSGRKTGLTVKGLAKYFIASETQVRRYCNELCNEGKLERIHGGREAIFRWKNASERDEPAKVGQPVQNPRRTETSDRVFQTYAERTRD